MLALGSHMACNTNFVAYRNIFKSDKSLKLAHNNISQILKNARYKLEMTLLFFYTVHLFHS